MEQWLSKLPIVHNVYLKIAEPRTKRLLLCLLYVFMTCAGAGVIYAPPATFEAILGSALLYVFGGFLMVGGLFAATAVLPGIWWLERAGLWSLGSGMVLYLIIIINLNMSPVGFFASLSYLVVFLIRGLDIKGAQLAPKAPVDLLEG